jgi:uncharacterized membrane protein
MGDEEEPQRPSVGAIGRMVFDAILAIVVAATGYYMTTIAQELRDLKASDDVIRATAAAFREQVARENVRKDEYRSDVSEIKSMLRDIQRDMQRKADRETIGPGVIRR